MQSRKQFQDADLDAAREMQYRQAQAQMEMQRRAQQARLQEQQMENDRYNFAITRAEEQDYVAKQNGLNEIETMWKDGSFGQGPEALRDYHDYRTQLMSGIKTFEMRRQNEQAKMIQQKTAMEKKAFDDNQSNIVLAQQLGKQTAGQNWIPITQANGDIEFYGYDPQKGTFYQIGKRTAGEQKPEPVSQFADETGNFSYKKSLPEAEAEAKAAYPVMKDEKTGADKNAEARATYTQEIVERHANLHRAGMQSQGGQQRQQQAAPQQNPQQAPQISIPQALARLAEITKQFPDRTKAPPAVQQEYDALMSLRNQPR